MKNKLTYVFVGCTLFVTATIGLLSQTTSQPPATVVHNDWTGSFLLVESQDFRLTLLDRKDLEDKVRRGKITLINSGYMTGEPMLEYSTSEWHTVSNALKQLRLLERTTSKPQIRVLQRDSILQSSYYSSKTPYEPWFLQRELQAGDAIIISMVR